MEEQDIKVETLRAALIEGEHSGPTEFFDINRFIDVKKRSHSEE